MMIFDFSSIDKLYVVGDIHGEFKTLFYNIKMFLSYNKNISFSTEIDKEFNYNRSMRRYRNNAKSFNNSVIIVAGDCGFGFNKLARYQNELKKYNNMFSECNTYIIFVRGNHDDPQYFNENILGFSNLICAPDYSVIKTKKFNTLCIGGAVSLDRTWRKKEEEKINRFRTDNIKKLYWDNEAALFDEKKINELIDSGININSIVTHACPSFVKPKVNEKNIPWFKEDSTLRNDLQKEDKVMDSIFNYFNDKNIKLEFWAHGHYHNKQIKKNMGVLFLSLGSDYYLCNPLSEIDKLKEQEKINNSKLKNKQNLFEFTDDDLMGFILSGQRTTEGFGDMLAAEPQVIHRDNNN